MHHLLRKFYPRLVWILLSFLTLVSVAYSATYNFYFNGTEQGDHSTANPQMTINGEQVTKKNDQAPAPEDIKINSSQPASEAAVGVGSQVQTPLTQELTGIESSRRKYFKFSLGYMLSFTGATTYYEYSDSNVYAPPVAYGIPSSSKISANFGWTPIDPLGVNTFFAYSLDGDNHAFGLELEVNPLSLTLFGKENFMEIGALFGFNRNLFPENHRGDDWNPDGEPLFSPHIGAKLTVNILKDLGVVSKVRLTGFGRNEAWIGDFGVQVYL